jgi:hypothetical protein
MNAFKRSRKTPGKFHGLNPAKPADSGLPNAGVDTPASKNHSKTNPKIKCGEQADCPLRTKCKSRCQARLALYSKK